MFDFILLFLLIRKRMEDSIELATKLADTLYEMCNNFVEI